MSAPTTAAVRDYWMPTPADLPHVREVAEHYWASAETPPRTWALAAVRGLGSVDSVLDLGCQCGPNLRVLHDAFPSMRLIGIDCNPHALAYGREWLPDAEFVEGTIPDALEAWPDRAVDVVLSTYCLAYQAPDTIGEAIKQALRIARRAVIIIEPMPNPDPERIETAGTGYVEWRHPYGLILGALVSETHVPRTLAWVPWARYERMTGAFVVLPVGGWS